MWTSELSALNYTFCLPEKLLAWDVAHESAYKIV